MGIFGAAKQVKKSASMGLFGFPEPEEGIDTFKDDPGVGLSAPDGFMGNSVANLNVSAPANWESGKFGDW